MISSKHPIVEPTVVIAMDDNLSTMDRVDKIFELPRFKESPWGSWEPLIFTIDDLRDGSFFEFMDDCSGDYNLDSLHRGIPIMRNSAVIIMDEVLKTERNLVHAVLQICELSGMNLYFEEVLTYEYGIGRT